MEGGGHDKEVAFSKFYMSIQKSIPYLWPRWQQNDQNWYPIYDQNGRKTLPFGAAHTYIAHIREYPLPHCGVLVLHSLSSSDDPTAFLNQLIPESIPWIPPWSNSFEPEKLFLFSINLLVVYRESVNLVGYIIRRRSTDSLRQDSCSRDCIRDPLSNLNQYTWREWRATFETDET